MISSFYSLLLLLGDLLNFLLDSVKSARVACVHFFHRLLFLREGRIERTLEVSERAKEEWRHRLLNVLLPLHHLDELLKLCSVACRKYDKPPQKLS